MLRRLASFFLRTRTLAGRDGRMTLDGDLALGGLEAVEDVVVGDPILASEIVDDAARPVRPEPTSQTNDDGSHAQSNS